MASVKLAAAALAVLVLVCMATTATATARAYRPEPQHEDCKMQAAYFKNCLSYGLRRSCCEAHVVTDPKCYCEVEREAVIECAHGKSCHGAPGAIKVRLIDLPCLEDLHCKRA